MSGRIASPRRVAANGIKVPTLHSTKFPSAGHPSMDLIPQIDWSADNDVYARLDDWSAVDKMFARGLSVTSRTRFPSQLSLGVLPLSAHKMVSPTCRWNWNGEVSASAAMPTTATSTSAAAAPASGSWPR